MIFPRNPHRRYHEDGTLPDDDEIFVFGSNDKGIHGKGAALIARQVFGAILGQANGLQGKSYGIPTRWAQRIPIPNSNGSKLCFHNRSLEEISRDIRSFAEFTQDRPELSFFVTAVGCGYAGYKASDVAGYFKTAINCSFPQEWQEYLEHSTKA